MFDKYCQIISFGSKEQSFQKRDEIKNKKHFNCCHGINIKKKIFNRNKLPKLVPDTFTPRNLPINVNF